MINKMMLNIIEFHDDIRFRNWQHDARSIVSIKHPFTVFHSTIMIKEESQFQMKYNNLYLPAIRCQKPPISYL